MSHRRRLLNLVMGNKLTGVCSLHHIDLHAGKNNLFYPTAAAAAAKNNDSPFSSMTLKKMKRIRLDEPRLSFQSMPVDSHRRLDCAALSETKTVFLDYHSRGGFIYDDAKRCVVTLPNLRDSKWSTICLAVAGAGEDDGENIFVIGATMYPAGDKEDKSQFQALVHRKETHSHPSFAYMNPWRCDELPPPPYIHGDGYRRTAFNSYGIVGGGLVCVSTEGVGTYCFDMASRTWVKAGDWALPFAGKVEHLPELGVLVGFPTGDYDQRLRASPLPWTVSAAVDGRRRPELLEASGDIQPPDAWKRVEVPQLVSLGSGKLSAVQFFESMEYTCCHCDHEEVDKRFAVFTGLEVVRDGDDGDKGKGGIRVVRHKSKRYMLPTDDNNIDIKSVL